MSVPRRILTPDEGNNLFPLPPDYEELTTEGTRLARVAACRQWQLYGPRRGTSPKERQAARKQKGDIYAACLRFFENHYLLPDRDESGDVIWNPMFYDVEDVLPNPRFHDIFAGASAAYSRVVMVAPRGASKSFLCARDMILRLLSRPGNSFVYATSSNALSQAMGNRVRGQLYFNEKISADWAPEPEFGGRIQPAKSRGTTSVGHFELTNRSWLDCTSIKSKQRGQRPRRYRLDDPEYDPEATTDMSELRAHTEKMLFKIIMPMVMRANCGVDWIGTYLSRQHLLYYATATHEKQRDGATVRVAEDPRFDSWVRINQPVMAEDANGRMKSCWPHMWPIDEAEKDRLDLDPDTVTIPQIKAEIGPAAFASEYMNDPGESDEHYFDPLTLERHGYRIVNPDAFMDTDPYQSAASIEWWEKAGEANGERQSMPVQMFLKEYGPTFALVDTSFTNTSTADYKAIVVCSRGPRNTLFVWDLWSGKCDESKVFVPKIVELCDKWRCSFVGVEVVRAGSALFGKLSQIINTRASDEFNVKHLAMPRKIHPGITRKEGRIAQALGWRVEMNRLKLPWLEKATGPWRRLFDQFETWNPNAEGGGLQHDDEIDALHMHAHVLKGRMSPTEPEQTNEMRAIDRLRHKDYGTYDKESLLHMALLSSSPSEIADLLADERDEDASPKKESLA